MFADYLVRANSAVVNHTAEHAGIYNIQGHYVAHGGDLIARQTLALEYASRAHVPPIVANQNGFSAPIVNGAHTYYYADGTLANRPVDLGITPQPSDYVNPVF